MRSAIAFAVIWLAVLAVQAGEVPCIHDHYDQIIVVRLPSEDSDTDRVLFVRNWKVIADRGWTDEMAVRAQGGMYCLDWLDYGNCHRAVTAPLFTQYWFDDDYVREDDGGPWWCMRRKMTDLEQP